jgi:excinuclease ABC subunit C
MAQAPLRIECLDISHLQGTDVVGSLVVFEDGLPRNNQYKRFSIKGFEGSDDTRAVHEVVSRRFRRYLDDQVAATDPDVALEAGESPARKSFAYPPQLLLVDGGAPQVAAAQRALVELGIDDVAVAGLAKRLEEVWLPGQSDPVILARSSEGLFLLQRVRDEAHRFALAYQRQKRGKRLIDSILDEVPGLGDVRRKALMRRFGSLKALRAASLDEISEVPGIGPRTAQSIRDILESNPAGAAVNVTTGEILEGEGS